METIRKSGDQPIMASAASSSPRCLNSFHLSFDRSRARRGCEPAPFRDRLQVRAEALRLLEKQDLLSRAWYVLEGQTFPDVFLRTADLMVSRRAAKGVDHEEATG